ncbi:MAG: hypothetical protein HA496_00965 [Thaumarchaeota archaeon]|nr:hypothetical protein [Nitrososphaerota archaeon]
MRIVIVLFIAFLLADVSPIRVSPWAHETHRQIARDILQYLPSDLKNLLERNIAQYLEGAIAPDTQFKDFVNHVWHVDENYGKAVDKIVEEVALIKNMIKQNASEDDIAFEFGVLSHYIMDLDNPLHTSAKDPNEDNYHSKFETYADSLLPIRYDFDGLTNVSDVRQRMVQTANAAYQYYDDISNFYRSSSSGSGAKYCGSKNSDVYHYPWCRYVSQIKPENLIWFAMNVMHITKGIVHAKYAILQHVRAHLPWINRGLILLFRSVILMLLMMWPISSILLGQSPREG